MTWTYSGIPSATSLDAVRFFVGDTDSSDKLVRDEEIEYALTIFTNPMQAAVLVLRAIQSKFARMPDCTVGDLSRSTSQIAAAFRRKADELEKQFRYQSTLRAIPFFGGISIGGKIRLDQDSDAIRPNFRIAQDDYRGTYYKKSYNWENPLWWP